MMTSHDPVVTAEPAGGSRYFGLVRRSRRIPPLRNGEHLYHATRNADGSWEFQRIIDENEPISVGEEDVFYRVVLASRPFAAVFARLAGDAQGNDWDCHLNGRLTVTGSRALLTRYAADQVDPACPLSAVMVESWVTNLLSQKVRQGLQHHSLGDVRDNEVPWWEEWCNRSLIDYGLALDLMAVSWRSAEAEAANAEAARQRELQRIAHARQKAREAELREAQAKAEYEKERKRIAAEISLSEEGRIHEMQLVEKRRQLEQVEADARIAAARQEAERAALEHELTLARLRRDSEAMSAAEEAIQRNEERFARLFAEIEAIKAALDNLSDLPNRLLAGPPYANPQTAHAATECFVSPEFSVPRQPSARRPDIDHQPLTSKAFFPMTAEQARGVQAAAARELRLPIEITNTIGMRLRLIPAGEFVMGAPTDERGRCRNEALPHRVRITRPFYLGVFPVTQGEYERVMGINPSYFREDSEWQTSGLPVESVSWGDAIEFCDRLSQMDSGWVYRLPTEAEWEYACRAGTTTPFHFGRILDGRQANCDGKHPYGTEEKGPSVNRTTLVGSYAPNGFGLFDLHGNVWEWCADWYAEYFTEFEDPPGPASGISHVVRGGSWGYHPRSCRSASRNWCQPWYHYNHLGFRVSVVPALMACQVGQRSDG